MPANNVNVEALRIVTEAAKKHFQFLEEEIRFESYDVDLGVGSESDVKQAKEDISLLETSIYMMEKHIDKFDSDQS